MTSAPFEIKVVYDASQRRRRGAVVRTASAQTVRGRGSIFVFGGLLNLLVAVAMYYVIWHMADPFLAITMIKKMPVEMPANVAANPFVFGSAPEAEVGQPAQEQESNVEVSFTPRWGGKTAQGLIAGAAYGWLAMATAAACAVALAAGSWLGYSAGSWVRLLGLLCTLLLAAALGWISWEIWQEYKTGYKVEHLRLGMGGVTLLFVFLGMAMSAKARGITKTAGIVVVLAAIATAVGIWLWTQTGALDIQYASWSKIGAAFGIHAAWGLVLLVTANRIRA
jgi:hypothetical protein